MGYRARVAELTEQEAAAQRFNQKRIAYNKARGMGGMVPADPVTARIRHLHDVQGVTLRCINRKTGITHSAILALHQGRRAEVRWATRQAILTARFTDDDVMWVQAYRIRRRLQALNALGYTFKWMAAETGLRHDYLHYVASHHQDVVTTETAGPVLALYTARHMHPAPVDQIGQRWSTRARNRAQHHQYAPPATWDNIDDPTEAPDWTGACGTPEGTAIHRREHIPLCDRCTNPTPTTPLPTWNHTAMKRYAKEAGHTAATLADTLNIHRDTVYRWWGGDRAPRRHIRGEIAFQLGIHVSDLETTP